ncbi:hypothetical protein [Myceligenerans salitolerans]|uniref:DUF559 domain-containing protein n=1 Tax=Myceligenerans salitolerans TaxID=1230528 RepID=A0ABS3IB57_9MICO|nr:hypothetical protein [Myceligenerans salitolerans]MBO0610266.1 hypothetical protein [Myceligenerans salitolerans]
MTVEKKVPGVLEDVARRQAGLVNIAQCERAGLGVDVRRRLVGSGTWSRLAQGVFDTSVTDPALHSFDVARHRIAWKGLLAVRGSAAVSLSALALLGAQGLPRTFDAEVSLPGGVHRRSRNGVVVRQYEFAMSTRLIGDARVVTPDWALAQALPRLDRHTAVAVMDSLRHQAILDDAGFARARELARGRRGMASRHEWFGDSDARAESPPESHARIVCADAGLRPDDLQRDVVSDDGEFLGRGDLLWYLGGGRWLVVEIDGARYHTGEDAMRRDNLRQNRMIGDGRITMLRFFPDDLRSVRHVTSRIAAILRQESWRPNRPLPAR